MSQVWTKQITSSGRPMSLIRRIKSDTSTTSKAELRSKLASATNSSSFKALAIKDCNNRPADDVPLFFLKPFYLLHFPLSDKKGLSQIISKQKNKLGFVKKVDSIFLKISLFVTVDCSRNNIILGRVEK